MPGVSRPVRREKRADGRRTARRRCDLRGQDELGPVRGGLNGTRSPYGVPVNAVDARVIPGGSSSGSATAVALGIVSFALGTDTAGSGRVPAGLPGAPLFPSALVCGSLHCSRLFFLFALGTDTAGSRRVYMHFTLCIREAQVGALRCRSFMAVPLCAGPCAGVKPTVGMLSSQGAPALRSV